MKAMTVDDAASAPCKPNDRANSVRSWGPKRAEPKHVTGKDQRLIECVIASLTKPSTASLAGRKPECPTRGRA